MRKKSVPVQELMMALEPKFKNLHNLDISFPHFKINQYYFIFFYFFIYLHSFIFSK